MDSTQSRFQDQNFRLSDFEREVAVVCPKCGKKALAQRYDILKLATLKCPACAHNEKASMEIKIMGKPAVLQVGAQEYFEAELWYVTNFKSEELWAYNLNHLQYLEQYIGAKLREHKDRTHFTLLEKLPKFYHEKKNRAPLLKKLEQLKKK